MAVNTISETEYSKDDANSDTCPSLETDSQEVNNNPPKSTNLQVSKVLTRPSYFNLHGNTGLHPPTHEFDLRIVKKLDSDFEDTIVELLEEEKLKTFLRIRPTQKQKTKVSLKKGKLLQIKNDTTIIAHPIQKTVDSFPGKQRLKQTEFKFTKILGPECPQSTVFDVCMTPLIEKFLRNENCLIFSYGATNSGKTYTLQGHGTEFGIIPRTLDAVFNRIHDRLFTNGDIKPHLYDKFLHLNAKEIEEFQRKKHQILSTAAAVKSALIGLRAKKTSVCSTVSSSSSKSASTVDLLGVSHLDQISYALFANTTMYSVWVSFAELYNERVYDLLDDVNFGKAKRRKEKKLVQDRNGYVYIKDLTEVHVTSAEEAFKIFQAGRKNLQFAATQMNERSSRSHSLFTLRVVTVGIGDGLMPYPKTVHRLTFCDLAGMERVHQTENEGCRLKESGNINNSLVILLKVIRLLREKQQHGNAVIETIPFRESKLTHIFKSFLTSSTHICMLVNVNPDPSMADSTLRVLNNSAIASNVIVFRPIEKQETKNTRKVHFEDNEQKHTRTKLISRNEIGTQSRKVFDSSSNDSSSDRCFASDSDVETSNSSANDGNATVITAADVTQEQRIAALIKENAELKKRLEKSERENQKLREDAVETLAEQHKLWSKRYEEMLKRDEVLSIRRLSLMRSKYQLNLSPGTYSSNYPPVLEMENINEGSEDAD